MSKEALVNCSSNIVHAQIFEFKRESSLRDWKEIQKCCMDNNCYNVLLEFFCSETIDLMESLNYMMIFKNIGITLKYRIAMVGNRHEALEGIRFTETILKNRGMINGGLFTCLKEAHLWLHGSARVIQ